MSLKNSSDTIGNQNRDLPVCDEVTQPNSPLLAPNVRVQNIYHVQNDIARSKNCKYRTAAILYTVETWFVSGI